MENSVGSTQDYKESVFTLSRLAFECGVARRPPGDSRKVLCKLEVELEVLTPTPGSSLTFSSHLSQRLTLVLTLATLIAAFGSSFQYGYNVAAVNSPSLVGHCDEIRFPTRKRGLQHVAWRVLEG